VLNKLGSFTQDLQIATTVSGTERIKTEKNSSLASSLLRPHGRSQGDGCLAGEQEKGERLLQV
jgi:hypothetical protein